MITLTRGLQQSLIILEILRNDEELNDVYISVGTFTNGREVGLTFAIIERQSFTWCIYEHRNSDNIIINGKEGYISLAGELPYQADSKYAYLAEFEYSQHYECAQKLKELMLEFYNRHKLAKKENS